MNSLKEAQSLVELLEVASADKEQGKLISGKELLLRLKDVCKNSKEK